MKVLLMGNPNVGKSALFNRITGARVTESNYPGTTIDYTMGYLRITDKDVEVIDVPGTFSLDSRDKAEEVAVKMLEESNETVVVAVIDASRIERGLYLALEILERGYRTIIALNMWDVAKDLKVSIDVEELQEILGVPIIPTSAVGGEGVKDLVQSLSKAVSTDIDSIRKRAEEAS